MTQQHMQAHGHYDRYLLLQAQAFGHRESPIVTQDCAQNGAIAPEGLPCLINKSLLPIGMKLSCLGDGNHLAFFRVLWLALIAFAGRHIVEAGQGRSFIIQDDRFVKDGQPFQIYSGRSAQTFARAYFP